MNGKLIFCTISSLLGILSAMEGITVISLFLLYLLGLLKLKKYANKWILINIIFYLIYFFIGDYTILHSKTTMSPLQTEFNVQFSDEYKVDGDRFRAVVSNTITKEHLILTYKIPSEKEKYLLQQHQLLKNTCLVQGTLTPPDPARNENAFNYQDYLKQKHIFWELQVTQWKISKCTPGQLKFLDNIKKFRLKGLALIEKNFTKETAPLAAALIFGSRDLLTEEINSTYQKLGVIHLISISGLHVALLIGMIFYLGIRMGAVRERISWVLILILPVYAIITGATPPVNRSVIMTMIILFMRQLQTRRFQSTDGLCVSLLILTFWNPLIINNIGFQLTYIVTISLLLSIKIVTKSHSYIEQMVVTSYISQASALPILLYYFFEIPLVSIVANLIFIPLYSFLFLPGLILLFLFQFISSDLFQLLSIFLSFTIKYSNYLAEHISSFSWTRLIPGKPLILFIILYAFSVLFSFYCWEKGKTFKWALLLPWLIMSLQILSPIVSPKGEVSFIDVGQGDSIFIQLPNKQGNYLIDTGGSISFPTDNWKIKRQKFEVGQDVIVPFLKSKGVSKLDLLILTHADMDHMGGSLSLLKEIKVERILLPSVSTELTSIEKELFKLAKKQKSKISYVYEGINWRVEDNQFHIISPYKNYSGDKNGGSIVLFAKVGGLNWLFTGDLDKEGEERLMKNYPEITIDVLKVGHHGSKTSTSNEFIHHYKPKYSIISVGKNNGFGHPHKEVLKILETGGSKIFRTDFDGEITYKFKGKSGTFYKLVPYNEVLRTAEPK
jgi:competence protein ComEC